MNTSVIIPAAGLGSRFGSDKPKQFLNIGTMPILIKTITLFDEIDEVQNIIIPVHLQWLNYTKELVEKYSCSKVKEVIIGGKERADSVRAGLNIDCVKNSDVILIHDAVRPLASRELIYNVMNAAEKYGAAIPVIPITDTVKQISRHRFIEKTLDRNKLAMAQTPQGYWSSILIDAYVKGNEANFEGTDSASFVEFFGFKVFVIDGEQTNIKITVQSDINYARYLL